MRRREFDDLGSPMRQQTIPRKAIQLLKKNRVDNCPQTRETLSNTINFICAEMKVRYP